MGKTCTYPGCDYPSFNNRGLEVEGEKKPACKIHMQPIYTKRWHDNVKASGKTYSLPRNKPLQRKNNNQGGKLTKAAKIKREGKEIAMMRLIWENRKTDMGNFEFCKCECTGVMITKFNPMNFAHVVSKGALVAAKLDPQNIVVVLDWVHTQMDAQYEGKTREDFATSHPKFYDKLQNISLKMKQLYG